MKFNIQKCKVLHLGKKNPRNFYLMFDNENKCLSTIKDIREQPDLGVQMDESLKFEKQISNVVQKANGVLASIRRTFKYINKDSFPVLYKSLVRPHLEYCKSIWSPYMVKDIKLIENVQTCYKNSTHPLLKELLMNGTAYLTVLCLQSP